MASFTQEDLFTERQIKSKKRVTDHAEVFTAKREVNAMLDLVKHETERIESTFLEPACGNGNFLVEILSRKLAIVEKKYKKSQLEYEHYSVLAISTIYGIDILYDNVCECRKRLFEVLNNAYYSLFAEKCKKVCQKCFSFILDKNIIHGDALSLKKVDNTPIIFSQWSFLNLTMLKRKEYCFSELIPSQQENDLFSFAQQKDYPAESDIGKPVFIPKAIKEYPAFNFLSEVGYA